jgi:hypothetical protein
VGVVKSQQNEEVIFCKSEEKDKLFFNGIFLTYQKYFICVAFGLPYH